MWIAFKNYYLRDEGQPDSIISAGNFRCELLSKIIIFVMKDNAFFQMLFVPAVVNCFQKLLSSWWRTTAWLALPERSALWIAFKNYYLRDEGQRSEEMETYQYCCELLSKIIIFVMKDNAKFDDKEQKEVVNCFQKLLSSWWRTTKNKRRWVLFQLWIAFKNYYLRDEGQPFWKTDNLPNCCELLSKIIIFVMKDNKERISVFALPVVNCFQKLLSSWWRTTNLQYLADTMSLWIAFKNYYLRDEGQQIKKIVSVNYRCELLSKIIIFVMKDN